MEKTKNRILIVDDEVHLLLDVKAHLEKGGYVVDMAPDGDSALQLAAAAPPDLVVLDITFPDSRANGQRSIDGIEILRRLREARNVPILMLSSTNISSVKVMALTLGADDFVSKPFDLNELCARIDAILRRSQDEKESERVLRFRHLRLDPGERRVWKDEKLIEMTGVEFDILYTLARRPNHVFTREKLLDLAWKDASYSIPKVIDVHIGHIRKKLDDDPNNPSFIVTVRGTGYRFVDAPAD